MVNVALSCETGVARTLGLEARPAVLPSRMVAIFRTCVMVLNGSFPAFMDPEALRLKRGLSILQSRYSWVFIGIGLLQFTEAFQRWSLRHSL